ncbi:unnamed protein product [Adineta ricciae]|uniref:Uncharacterized protein n=1 Tax=Adineta ricciae TaxID=249248 RepID=A0A813PPK8_ADIRI|nr:unnamed protein product [Adineta ricciae]
MSFSYEFCKTWAVVGPSMYITAFTLMAWASIERHILIFHPSFMSTKVKRFLFHYVPLVVCILWPAVFYFVTQLIMPCDVILSSTRRYCGLYSCVTYPPWGSYVDSIGNYIAPAFITVVFSLGLFVRVLCYRHHAIGWIKWRKYKKLAFQLLPLSVLYLVLQFPAMILYAAYTAGLSYYVAAEYYSDSLYMTFWIVLLIPFACALSLPDLGTRCKRMVFFWRPERTIVPHTVLVSRRVLRPKGGTVY